MLSAASRFALILPISLSEFDISLVVLWFDSIKFSTQNRIFLLLYIVPDRLARSNCFLFSVLDSSALLVLRCCVLVCFIFCCSINYFKVLLFFLLLLVKWCKVVIFHFWKIIARKVDIIHVRDDCIRVFVFLFSQLNILLIELVENCCLFCPFYEFPIYIRITRIVSKVFCFCFSLFHLS